jgi:hypothetical protein
MGGINPPPSWDEYLEQFIESARPKILAIRELLVEEGLVGRYANEMANDTIFYFPEDSFYIQFSWRAWGDLMQSVVNKREGYMRYYC